ncbi:MAG: SCO family protein [Verrucomicrobia bacterium]|nr:SCO family protein [Verrucomicrobiota bacterium]
MPKPERKLEWIVWSILAAVVLVIAGVYVSQRGGPQLKMLRHLPDFTLTNQFDQAVSLSSLRGDVWLANIIFTRCPGPCARMTKQFSEIQAALPKDKAVKLVTLTADPGYDTPSVLKAYAERTEADSSRWHFLTGPKEEVYRVALEGLMLAVQEKTPTDQESADDLFIHSTLFVLVDKRGNVRSFYESTDEGLNQRILGDVKQLLRER